MLKFQFALTVPCPRLVSLRLERVLLTDRTADLCLHFLGSLAAGTLKMSLRQAGTLWRGHLPIIDLSAQYWSSMTNRQQNFLFFGIPMRSGLPANKMGPCMRAERCHSKFAIVICD